MAYRTDGGKVREPEVVTSGRRTVDGWPVVRLKFPVYLTTLSRLEEYDYLEVEVRTTRVLERRFLALKDIPKVKGERVLEYVFEYNTPKTMLGMPVPFWERKTEVIWEARICQGAKPSDTWERLYTLGDRIRWILEAPFRWLV